MAFCVGQKVVCIKKGEWKSSLGVKVGGGVDPKYGDVLTIREIDHCYHHGDAGLLFEEIVNPGGKFEPNYCASKFRPIVEGKTETGMAILKGLLNTKSKELVE